jgi:hypothetical protein
VDTPSPKAPDRQFRQVERAALSRRGSTPAALWRVVIEQRKDLDDELRRLAMREHEPRR